MNKTLDVVIVGELNLDLILSGLPAQMPLERELLATGFDMTLGSSSAILAHNLARLGAKVGFVTMIGTDRLGHAALDYLRRANVDLSHILHSRQGLNTGVTILLTHGSERHILTYPGTMNELSAGDLDLTYLTSARHFHLSSLFLQKGLQPCLPALFRKLKAAGLTLSLDTNDDPEDRWESGLDELLSLVDIVMPNESEACRITGKANAEDAAEELARKVPLVAIKCGARGALIRHHGQSTLVEGLYVTPVDTIGAGDSFNAGFLKGFTDGLSPVECAKLGNRVAALSTQRAGGVAAMCDPELRQAFLNASPAA